MALKSFESALDDCQVAALLRNDAPSSKTLGRLAKCHLALGDHESAIRAAQRAIECDPVSPAHPALSTKATAELMQQCVAESRDAWQRRCWAESRRNLDKATALCEMCPPQWLAWGVQIDMARGNWDAAMRLAE